MVNVRNVVLWLHIVVGMVTLGPLMLFDVVGAGMVRARNAGAVRFMSDRAKVLGPSTLLVALLGIVLVLRSGEDPYTFSQGWVIAALVLYVAMVAVGAGVSNPTLSRAADKLEAGEDATAEATRLRLLGAFLIADFLVILWLMVAKPGM